MPISRNGSNALICLIRLAPFYQDPFDESLKTIKPLSQLAEEMATGNNATLFDHSFEASEKGYSPAQTARFLLARQAYGFAGTGGYFNSTMIAGYSVLVLGENLFETLALNLIKYDEELPIPHLKENSHSIDLPFWEQNIGQQLAQKERNCFGYLDYLTWQSRQIHIITKEYENTLGPSHCQYSQKLKLKNENLFDPFKAYYKGKEKGFAARKLIDSRALWRDSHSLLEATADPNTIRRPEVFNHLAQIEAARRRKEDETRSLYRFAVLGMVNEQASVSMWSREILPLPLSYLIEKQLTAALNKAIQLTEAVETPLKEAIKKLSIELVGKVDAPKFSDSFQAKELYSSTLNAPFKQLLSDLAIDESLDDDDEIRYGATMSPKWAKFVARQADNALQHSINSLRSMARELKAASLAKTEFNKQMGKVKKDFPNLFPKGENQ